MFLMLGCVRAEYLCKYFEKLPMLRLGCECNSSSWLLLDFERGVVQTNSHIVVIIKKIIKYIMFSKEIK